MKGNIVKLSLMPILNLFHYLFSCSSSASQSISNSTFLHAGCGKGDKNIKSNSLPNIT